MQIERETARGTREIYILRERETKRETGIVVNSHAGPPLLRSFCLQMLLQCSIVKPSDAQVCHCTFGLLNETEHLRGAPFRKNNIAVHRTEPLQYTMGCRLSKCLVCSTRCIAVISSRCPLSGWQVKHFCFKAFPRAPIGISIATHMLATPNGSTPPKCAHITLTGVSDIRLDCHAGYP